jgi:predicted  nucleic acid-binding Zn-ribbon protein
VEAWTDERLDDLAATLRPLPAQIARNTEAIERLGEEMHSMRGEMAALRSDSRAEFAALRADLSASQRQIAQIGWAMATALVGLMIALMIAAL